MRYLYLNKTHGHRDSCNPLRGLNMSRLIALQEAGERGQYTDLMWLYYYIERSDAMIHRRFIFPYCASIFRRNSGSVVLAEYLPLFDG